MTSVYVRLNPQQISLSVGFSKHHVAISPRMLAYGVALSPVVFSTVDFLAPTHAIASPTSVKIAQAFLQRRPPTIPVPLPSRSKQYPSATAPLIPTLIPTERELLESLAPGSHFGSSAFSSLNPPSGPLQVPDNRIPIGQAGHRSDVSSFTAAQMPWNDNPSRQSVGGGGAQFPVASTLSPSSRPPSTIFPQSQVSAPRISAPQIYNSQLPKPYFAQSQPSWPQLPVANARSLPRFPAAQPPPLVGQPSAFGQPPRSPIPSESLGHYRVFMALPPHASQANQLQAQLRLWVNDAFVTVVRGQRVLQLGSFRDRDRANLMFEQLRRLGFWPQIEVTTQ